MKVIYQADSFHILSPAGLIFLLKNKIMTANIGLDDRMIRFAIGMIVASVLINQNSVWALSGLVIFITAATGFCPLYKLLGINTKKATDGEM